MGGAINLVPSEGLTIEEEMTGLIRNCGQLLIVQHQEDKSALVDTLHLSVRKHLLQADKQQ